MIALRFPGSSAARTPAVQPGLQQSHEPIGNPGIHGGRAGARALSAPALRTASCWDTHPPAVPWIFLEAPDRVATSSAKDHRCSCPPPRRRGARACGVGGCRGDLAHWACGGRPSWTKRSVLRRLLRPARPLPLAREEVAACCATRVPCFSGGVRAGIRPAWSKPRSSVSIWPTTAACRAPSSQPSGRSLLAGPANRASGGARGALWVGRRSASRLVRSYGSSGEASSPTGVQPTALPRHGGGGRP